MPSIDSIRVSFYASLFLVVMIGTEFVLTFLGYVPDLERTRFLLALLLVVAIYFFTENKYELQRAKRLYQRRQETKGGGTDNG